MYIYLGELLTASPEGLKRVRLSQFNRKTIPKKRSRVTESFFMGKRNSEIAVGVSQRINGDTATIGKFRPKIIRS